MAEPTWKAWPEECPECGYELEVLSDDTREAWACDGDPVRCSNCGATGHISCSAEEDCYVLMTELSTEQAFAALEAVQQHTTDPRIIEPLRLALVRLRELETQEQQGPSDEDLHQLWLDLYAFHDGPTGGEVAEIARAVLDRWCQRQQNKETTND